MNNSGIIFKKLNEKRISLSSIMTGLVVGIILAACIVGIGMFAYFYINAVEESVATLLSLIR